jgi:putative transposase
MQVELVNEAFTSQTCPRCRKRNKAPGRSYQCKCGLVGDRDVVGAANIRRKYLEAQGQPVVEVMSPSVVGVRYHPYLPCRLV